MGIVLLGLWPKPRVAPSTVKLWIKATVGLGLTWWLASHPLPFAAQSQTDWEYRAKARYLAHFPSFVGWPADAISTGQESFRLCAVGDYPFRLSLSQEVSGRTYDNLRIEVRRIDKPEEARSCQILFVSRSEQKKYRQIFESLSGQAVLTVGETPDFLDAGGMVSFSVEEESLHFDVNLAAAYKAHLKLSSRLLALARHVSNATAARS